MHLQTLNTDALAQPRPHHDKAALAASGVVGCIGDAAFGQRVIEQLNRLLPLCWWNVYQLLDDAPPQLRIGGCLGAEDCIATAFGAYRAGLYRQDPVLGLLRAHAAEGRAMMSNAHARDLQPEHRRRIYSRHGLSERLSLTQPGDAASMLMINLYRHESQRPFSDDERDALLQVGPLLLASAARHLDIVAQLAAARRVSLTAGDTATTLTGVTDASALAVLTRREREVCDRLLRGWTHDGIAADLQLSVTTVKTYRDRAFDRLGIHHRNELFALVMAETRAGL